MSFRPSVQKQETQPIWASCSSVLLTMGFTFRMVGHLDFPVGAQRLNRNVWPLTGLWRSEAGDRLSSLHTKGLLRSALCQRDSFFLYNSLEEAKNMEAGGSTVTCLELLS